MGGGILQMRVTAKNLGALLGQRGQQGIWELLDVPDALHPIPVQVLQLRHRAQRLQEAGAGAGRRVQGQRRVPGRGRAAPAQGTATPCASRRRGAQGHWCVPQGHRIALRHCRVRSEGEAAAQPPAPLPLPVLPSRLPLGSRWESRRGWRSSLISGCRREWERVYPAWGRGEARASIRQLWLQRELLSQAQAGAGEPASKQPISFEVRLSPRAAQARTTRGWREGNGRRWFCLLSQLESKRGRFVSTLPVKTGAGDSDVPAERPYVGSVPW